MANEKDLGKELLKRNGIEAGEVFRDTLREVAALLARDRIARDKARARRATWVAILSFAAVVVLYFRRALVVYTVGQMHHVLLLFLSDTFERFGICLLVDEPARFRIPLDPAVCFWVMNLRSVSNRSMTVPISRRRIFRHFIFPLSSAYSAGNVCESLRRLTWSRYHR
jgi:hypothetical protein